MPTLEDYGYKAPKGWTKDEWAWHEAKVRWPWDALDTHEYESAERRYWAGEWEQKYDSYLVFASLAMTLRPVDERWLRFCAGIERARYAGARHVKDARIAEAERHEAWFRVAQEQAEEVMMGRT